MSGRPEERSEAGRETMSRDELLEFLRAHRIAVEATIAPGGPQAAVIGYAVSDQLEIVFDTLETSRKCQNLRRDPRIALVVGWDEQTVQLEGVADEPTGDELARIRAVYLSAYPDGVERLAWPGITHVRVRLTWARYSDFRGGAAKIVEVTNLPDAV